MENFEKIEKESLKEQIERFDSFLTNKQEQFFCIEEKSLKFLKNQDNSKLPSNYIVKSLIKNDIYFLFGSHQLMSTDTTNLVFLAIFDSKTKKLYSRYPWYVYFDFALSKYYYKTIEEIEKELISFCINDFRKYIEQNKEHLKTLAKPKSNNNFTTHIEANKKNINIKKHTFSEICIELLTVYKEWLEGQQINKYVLLYLFGDKTIDDISKLILINYLNKINLFGETCKKEIGEKLLLEK